MLSIPYAWRRKALALWIRTRIQAKFVAKFLRELFSYEVDKREKLSSQLVIAITGISAVFLLWAYLAEFDQVVSAEAKVYPFSRLQTIEHFEGGRVSKIHVRQGDLVKAGDLLVSLSPLQSKSELNVQKDNVATLGIRLARLGAEYEGKPTFMVDESIKQEFSLSYANELALFNERRRQRLAEMQGKRSEVEAARAKQVASEFSAQSARQELEVMGQLVSKGLEPRLSLIRSEKSMSDAQAQLSTSQQEFFRARAQLDGVIQEQQTAILSELSKVRSEYISAKESVVVVADKADRTELRTPIDGTVNRVLVSTEGGTIKPGDTVVEIVPSDATIIVEASIAPADIGFIQVGQPALVKITAYDFSIFGSIEGVVDVVTADSITDEKGNQFYIVKINLQGAYLRTKNQNLKIIPGMTAQVDIVTGKRTALQYVFSPITRVLQESLREK
jgi:membrane fusion protein, adhesin transport system